MNRFAYLAVLLIPAIHADGREAVDLTPSEVLKVITIFQAEPLSERGRGASSIIVAWAEDSEAVTVELEPDLCTWIGDEPPIKHQGILLTALIAGNLRSQLETGVDHNDHYSALLFLFQIYNRLKAEDDSFVVAEIEEQIKVHKEGRLHEYIESRISEKSEETSQPGAMPKREADGHAGVTG